MKSAQINCLLGPAWFGHDRMSSFSPSVMLVTINESSTATETVYGFFPPLICSSNGSHVWSDSDVDTFAASVMPVEGDEGRQLDVVLLSESAVKFVSIRGRTIWQRLPTSDGVYIRIDSSVHPSTVDHSQHQRRASKRN